MRGPFMPNARVHHCGALHCYAKALVVLDTAGARLADMLALLARKDNRSVVEVVAFSPKNDLIVSGSRDQTLKVWDAGVSALTPSNP